MRLITRILATIKPISLFDWWTILVFLVAVTRLLLIHGLALGVLILFLVPPLFAFGIKNLSQRQSSRFVASLFLTLVSVGHLIGLLPFLFPKFGGVNAQLPPDENRMLSWYVLVYLLYLFMVLPFFVFIRGLSDHKHKRASRFSRSTCVFGILAFSLIAPTMVICLLPYFFHVLPNASK